MQRVRAGEMGGDGMSDLQVRDGLATGSVVTGKSSRMHAHVNMYT